MKKGIIILAASCAFSSLAFAAELKNDQDKVSYSIGYQMGQDFKQQGIPVTASILSQGFSDGFASAKPQMTTEQMQTTLNNFRKKLISQKQAEAKALSDSNKKSGEAFLTNNKKQAGVVTLADGLQYKVIKAGTGVAPKEGETITVNYSGKFVDGKEFDSSYQRGKPAVFVLSKELIPGWVEALKLMKAGSTWELYVPAHLAYGERGVGPIGPNQVLIFKIELLSVAPTAKK